MQTIEENLYELQRIPGVGPSMAQDLIDLGIRRVRDLRRRNPETLYERLCEMRGEHIDRCVLYVFRCAVYFASEANPDPERLQWWTWKDGKTGGARVKAETRGKPVGRLQPKRRRDV